MSRVKLIVACLASCGLIAAALAGSAPAEEAPTPVVEEAPPVGQTGTTTSETRTTPPPPASAEKSAGETTEPSPPSFSLEGPLVTPGSPTEAEEQWAAEAAQLASPGAVQGREESEIAYSGLSSTESKELASTTFPTLVDEPNGGAPKLPEGAHITSFPSEFAAAVDLPGGEHGTVESVAPIAVNTPAGTVPVNLTPQQAGSGFEAATPANGMHVRAGGKLSEGASLSDLGVTLTPVTEGGTPLEGARSIDGASIFYGNSENSQAGITDTDSLVKFDTYGFSEETILRSDLAPQKLYFLVGLPEGASLVQAQDEPRSLQVVAAGQTIATIAAPSGRDAEGTKVPVTLSVSGNMVTLSVEHQPGQYKLPIEVDPTTYDTQVLAIHNGVTYQSRWKVGTSNGKEGPFYFSEGFNFGIRDYHGENTTPGYTAGEWGGFAYTTQGESSIYDVHVTSSLGDEGHGFEAQVKLTNKVKTGKNEPSASHLDSYSEGSWPGWELCMLSGCAVPTEVTKEIEENSYSLVQFATRTGNYTMNAELWGAWVYIVQTKNSTVSFDTADSEIAGVPNALYGTEHWVRGAAGVVKGIAKDPGIGISELGFSSANESKWGVSESFLYPNTALCQGVICPQEETRTVNLTGLPDGKDTVTFAGQNNTDTKAQAAKASATVYVDNTAPYKIVLSGLPASKEIGGGEYKLTAEATDGTEPTPSSGMKSMTLLVDGKEVGSLMTPCSPGHCTAHSGTWTIFGHNYATGRHTVTVNATDNAGNVGSESFAMIVHPASPVAMGPGMVNPLSGELSLTATDVSLGSGLAVDRSYSSQHLTSGESGPVSAQWGFSLGGQESLVKQPDGSMVLMDASGGQTIFPSDGKGGYVSPVGDSNLTLSSTPCEAGQSEFMLKNAAAATTTCFKVPVGGTSEVWTPSIAKGAVATETVTYAFERAEPHQARHEYSLPTGSEPFGVTTGPDGNIWFTDEGTSKIGKTTISGTITEYALPAGSSPHGIVNGPDNNLWFSDRGSSKIGKITTAGVITEYALPTKSWPEHIAVGPDGNLWFVDKGTAKVGKITTAGVITEYALAATSEPEGITAGPDGNLWFTNFINNKLAAMIGKVTTAGVVTEYSAKSCPSDIVSGPDGKLWFSNYCNNKIGKITTTGEITEYALPSNSNPNGITTGPEGKLWFTDRFSSKVGSITTEGAVVEYAAGTGSEPEGIVTGPDKNLWFAEEGAGKIAMLAPPEPGAKPIIEPIEALAPVPAGVSCSPELKPGCRALTFNYAESTTATGEAQSEWGDYNGHLTRIYYTAYDPVSKTMKTVEIAHYLYDKKARLRTEWNPSISPGLKTVYGYDSEGHLTSMTQPGQETWAFTYGTTPGDGNSGRIVKALQAPASTKLWTGGSLANSESPRLSGTPVVGVRMAVSDGKWSGEPVTYGYQWEDCNAGGGECVAVAGATNPNYTPRSSDVGHTLVAKTTATNGGGSVTLATSASAVVSSTWQEHSASRTQLVDGASSINAVSCVPNTTDCVVGDSKGNAFYASNVSATGAASWKAWNGPGTSPSEALACPSSSLCLMAAGEKSGYGGNLYYATSLGGAWTLAYSPSYGVDAISCTSNSFCADGQDGGGYFRWSTSPASSSWNLQSQGSATMKGVSCLSVSFCVIADSKGSVHAATSESQVKSSSWTETSVDGTTALNGIACLSTSSCVAVDSAGNVLNLTIAGNGAATVSKQDIDATNSLTALACAAGSTCVAVDTQGNVFVSTDSGVTWKKEFTNGGDLTSVSCASSSLCVTASTTGNVMSFDPTLTQPLDETSPLNAVSCIPNTTDCVVSDGKGNAYYATNVSAGGAASWKAWTGPGIGPSEAVNCPSTGLCLMAAGEDSGYGGNLYYATSLGGAWTQAYSPVYGVDAISCSSSSFCADGQDGGGYFRWSATPASSAWELESQGTAAVKAIACRSASFCALADSAGTVRVATTETQVKSSSWTETNVDGSTALNGIACTSTSSCVAVDNAGNVLNLTVAGNGAVTAPKQDIDGTTSLTAVACVGASTCTAVDSSGNVFASTNAGAGWSEEYQLGKDLTSVSCSSSSLCATVDTAGRVTAFNPTSGTKGSSYTQSIDGGSSLNAVSCVPSSTDCVISDGNGNAFYATNVSTSSTPTWKAWSGPGEGPSKAVACPTSSLCLLATGNSAYGGAPIYYATSLGGAWALAYAENYGVESLSCASSSFCVAGAIDGVFRWSEAPTSSAWGGAHQEPYVVGNHIKAVSCLTSSFCAMASAWGYVYIATSTAQIKSETWTKTDVDGSTALNGIACTSTSSCIAVDGKGNVLKLAIAANGTPSTSKQDIDGTTSINAISCSGSTCAAVDAKGNVFTSTDGGETWNGQYTPGGDLTSVSCASSSLCVTVNTQGETTAFNAAGIASEASARSPQPGTTIEYGVPVSGEGAPQNLSKEEVEKWGQKDLPTEATAIFPPDEPQGWPAGGYKRATIYYRDSTSRPVNVATPSGAISTTEYNEHNDVVRSLTPDNRAAALKEANPAAASKLLDTQSEYNSEGTELLNTLGPRHAVKLPNGTEVQARSHTVYHYDEGAPAEGGPYRLVTKTTQGAQVEGEAEQDIRTTATLYSGQNNLGWTLRKPTAVIADPNGLKLTHRTVYDPGTGNVVETRTPAASGPLPYLRYQSSWGTTGQPPIDRAEGVAIDKEGDIWVADTENNRIVELWSNGTFRRTVGSAGSENGQFNKPAGIATDSTGNVWVADTGNSRVQELSSTGTYLRQAGKYGTGNGEFKSPRGITVDSTGHVWVADTGNNRVQELSSEAAYMTQYGSQGTGNGQFNQPYAVAVDKEANIWVGDSANGRIQELSSTGTYIRQFGREGNTKPCKEERGEIICENWWAEGLTIDAAGHIWETEAGKVEEFSSTGTAITHFGTFGHGEGQFEYAKGIALDAESHVWIADSGNTRIQEVSSTGAYIRQYPATPIPVVLNNPKSFSRTGAGNWLLADTGNNRLQEATSGGSFSKQSFYQTNLIEGVGTDEKGAIWFSSQSGGYSMIVRESSTMGPEWATTSFVGAGEGGNFNQPAGIAFAGEKMYVADRGNNRIIEGEKGSYVRRFGTVGSGNGQLSEPHGVALDSKGNVWVADTGNNRVEEFTGEGAYVAAYGTAGSGNGQFSKPQGVAVDNEGNVWIADTGNNRVEVLSSTGVYIQKFGSVGSGSGQMKEPTDITTDTAHHVYVLDAGNGRVQTWLNEGESEYAPSPHGALIVYYTTASNSKYPSCGGHPEWANLPCETLPSAQPETSGVPNLPTTLHTYNMYREPMSTTSTVGTSTRTTTITYDEAGRNTSSETTSNVGEALPKVNDKYSETTGTLIEQYTSTESLKSAVNSVGQLTSYTDADGNVTTYEYENGGDTRLTHLNDGKGTQTYTYDSTTGAVKELSDSAAGTFTATYDVEGNLISEGYPNAMSANLTINAASQATAVKYIKNADCANTCPETWYTDTIVPSIHGQWLSQQSTQATQAYTYDQVGRVTQVQDTPAGKGCVMRLYSYDEETNRTSMTTREPGTGGACATEGGSTESHSYDSANRLLDAGISYDSFGNTTKLSASDAGGSEGGWELTSGFYDDNQIHSETQNGQTITYQIDPAGRDREIVSTGKVTATEIQHFAGPRSTTPLWTGELSSNYTRNVTGISGAVAGIQHNNEKPVLQVTNLHGDIVATATDSETATALASTVKEASEYGVPATEAPPKYSWLGAHEVPTTLPAGAMGMGARSYIPQLGRYLQTDPVAGGSANAYSYVAGDPTNTTDLSGAYTWGFGGSLAESLNAHGSELAAAYEAEVRAEAEQLAEEDAEEAEMWSSLEAAMPEEEWGEEEGAEEEYAAFKEGAGARGHDHGTQSTQSAEGGVFFQELSGEEGSSVSRTISPSMMHRCEQHIGKAACATYVGFFGWLKKEVKAKWNWIKTAAKASWNTVKVSVLATFKTLGYGDLACYKTRCLVLAVETTSDIYDGFQCVRDQDCEAFSQDISEVEIGKSGG